MIVTFRIRRDTAANWTSANPVLALGEPGLETDTRRVKYGDGSTSWNALPYSAVSVAWGAITGKLTDQTDLVGALAGKLSKAMNLSDLADIVVARSNLGLKGLAVRETVNGNDWSGADLAIADGGTGASTAAVARSNLGALGTVDKAVAGGVASLDANVRVPGEQMPAIFAQKSAAYTLALSDRGGVVLTTAGAITIPANVTVAFPAGSRIRIMQWAGAAIAISRASGVALYWYSGGGSAPPNADRTLANGGWLDLIKLDNANTWAVVGGQGVS
jgi:hypothetical protein